MCVCSEKGEKLKHTEILPKGRGSPSAGLGGMAGFAQAREERRGPSRCKGTGRGQERQCLWSGEGKEEQKGVLCEFRQALNVFLEG